MGKGRARWSHIHLVHCTKSREAIVLEMEVGSKPYVQQRQDDGLSADAGYVSHATSPLLNFNRDHEDSEERGLHSPLVTPSW